MKRIIKLGLRNRCVPLEGSIRSGMQPQAVRSVAACCYDAMSCHARLHAAWKDFTRVIVSCVMFLSVALAFGAEQARPPAGLFDEFKKAPTAAAALQLAREGPADARNIRRGLLLSEKAAALMAWAVYHYPNAEVRRELEGMLNSPDQVGAYWAARALGRIGSRASIPALAAQLPAEPRGFWEVSTGGPGARRRMLYFKYKWNRKLRRNVRVPLWAPPDMPNIRVAYAAVEALGCIGGEDAAKILMREIKRDHYLIRYGAVRALGWMRYRPALGPLRELAERDPVLIVRRAAKESVERLEGKARLAVPESPPMPPAIVFIKAKERTESNLAFRDAYPYPRVPWYAWGENLYSLSPPQPDGVLKNLTNLDKGAVQGAELSYDGKKILFAMRRDFATDGFHIYEMNVDGTGLRQLTSGNCNDVDPQYLPDGRIVFCSDRAGYREYYHQERSRVLYVRDADGSVHQVTFNPNSDFEPLVLPDGRIVYASYRFYGQDGGPGAVPEDKRTGLGRIETVLRTILSDGTQDQLFYGSMRGGFYSTLLPLPYANQYQTTAYPRTKDMIGVGVSFTRVLPDGRLVCVTPSGLTVVDTSCSPTDCEMPVYPEIMNLAGGEEVYIHNFDDQNPIGRFTAPYPVGGDWVLVSHAPWYDTRLNGYGIYLFNLKTRELRLVYDDPEMSDVDALPVVARPVPPVVPTYAEVEKEKTGYVYCQSVFNSDLPFDRSRVAYVRVLEAVQMGLAINANGGFETRILGTVPIARDGSFYVEVPADTPFHFELLDIDGNTLVHETDFNYVRGGERKGCAGCHEPKGTGVPERDAVAMHRSPYRALRNRGDLIYEGRHIFSYTNVVRE